MSGASLPTLMALVVVLGNIVLIPDEWGKSSDPTTNKTKATKMVLIPDEWGKSSDTIARFIT